MSDARRGAPRWNRLAHIAFAVLAAAVLVFVLTRGDSSDSQPEADPGPVLTVVETSPITEPIATSTPVTTAATPPPTTEVVEEAAEVTTSITSPQEQFRILSPAGQNYTQGLADFKNRLQALVVELSAANTDWDNRQETGVGYSETEETVVEVGQRIEDLARMVRDQEVPVTVQDRHSGADGLVPEAERLVDLAEAVLAGLRLPSPDDGSARRTALADFFNGVDEFNQRVDSLIGYVEENASELGLMVTVSSTTTTTRPSQVAPESTTTTTRTVEQLSAEATAYLAGLDRFKVMLAELVESSNAANLAWDGTAGIGVTYQTTESALVEILDRIVAWEGAVQDHRVPDPLEGRGNSVIEMAADLAPLAEAVLQGLRIPAPEDGSVRRSALADLNSAAADFSRAVDDLDGYVEENAGALGLLE